MMASTWRSLAFVLVLLAPACSSSGDDDASPSAGASSGGSTQGSGGSAQGGSAGHATVDCHALCGQIKTLCATNAQIDDTWLSVCESACNARVQVLPEAAAQWKACVDAAADCNAGVQCVATTGSGGSAGSK